MSHAKPRLHFTEHKFIGVNKSVHSQPFLIEDYLLLHVGRVVSQAQFQIGAAPQKAENRSKIGATPRGVPSKN